MDAHPNSASFPSSEHAQGCPQRLESDALVTLAMLPGLGPRTLAGLLDHFGTATRALSAPETELARIYGIGPKLVHTIQTATHHVSVDSIRSWCQRHDVAILAKTSPGYPDPIQDLTDAPPILFVRGELLESDAVAVAIVGTRHATTYGLKQARHLAYSLSKAGVTVVSGLARGIDAAAHEGAIDAGGRTVAVLGSGHAHIYPREHSGLAHAIAADGAVISEFAPDTKPRAGTFPQRNRLIAGLAVATLVIEAPDRSGSLITARLAMEQNREVLALPGPVTSRASRGCNQLIRDGATLVQSVDEILEAIGPLSAAVTTESGRSLRNPAELTLNEIEQRVLDAIDETGTLIDQVIASSGLPAQRVIAVVSVLEVRRLIRRLSGQYVARI